MATPVNKFGRKGGRGVRPFLLIPKVLGVAAYFGGLVAATALVWSDWPGTVEEFHALGGVLRRIFLFAAVPGLLLAILFGVILLLQHPGVFLRMRWLRVKLLIVAVAIPAFHLWISGMVAGMRQVTRLNADLDATFAILRVALLLAVVVTAGIIALGRHKPRLGTPTWVNHEGTKSTKRDQT